MGILAICDKETVFTEILAEYLRKKYRSELEIEAFSDVEKLLSMAAQKEITLCLIGEGMLESGQLEELLTHTEHIIFLSGKRKKDCIFKYQSVEQLTKDLLFLCSEKEIMFLEEHSFWSGSKNIEVKAFYSPVHHIMQSCLALTMGQLLAKDKKVLYLNFEPYSGFESMMQKTYKHNLMDLFFFLKEDKGKFRLRMESMTETVGGLDYIPPVFCYPDMEDVDIFLWQKLLRRIMEELDYEILILDLCEQTRGVFSMLEISSEIYTCVADDGLIRAKTEQYENLLRHMKKEKILEKTITCIVPEFREVPVSPTMFTHSELAQYVRSVMVTEKKEEEGEFHESI